MKTFKRFSAILLTVLLMVSMMVVPASADDPTYSISINNQNPGHTYQAYQIFEGDLSEGGVLSNVRWGEGVDATTLGSAGTHASSLTTTAAAAAFAEMMLGYLTSPSNTATAATVGDLVDIVVAGQPAKGYKIENLEAGYYLVRDMAGTLGGVDEAHTSLMLKVVDNVTLTPKASKATVTKKVSDPANFTSETDNGWVDATDGKEGDVAQFLITATLPNDYEVFDSYELTFHEKMASGLEEPDSGSDFTVKIDGTQINSGYSFVPAPSCDKGCTFHIKIADLKDEIITEATAKNNSAVTVEYGAKILDTATFGKTSNNNTVRLEYSNDPYGGTTTGITAADTVAVFTYKLEIYKRTHDSQPLTGAAFKLEKYDKDDGSWAWVDGTGKLQVQAPGDSFFVNGVDEGIFRVTETVTPSGYNTIEPFYFRVDANYSVNSDNPILNSLSISQCAEDGSALGVNDINPLVTTLSDADTGVLTLRIANRGGTQLPETGGIGTTIFYGIGGVLMLGALCLLLVRKRNMAK